MPADSRSDALLVQLAELHRARKTGRLVVARGAQILFIYLRQGQIAGVESESAPEAGGTDPDEPVFLDPLDLGRDPGLARAAARERLLEARSRRPPRESRTPPSSGLLSATSTGSWASPSIPRSRRTSP